MLSAFTMQNSSALYAKSRLEAMIRRGLYCRTLRSRKKRFT